jgi:hypothetical protein
MIVVSRLLSNDSLQVMAQLKLMAIVSTSGALISGWLVTVRRGATLDTAPMRSSYAGTSCDMALDTRGLGVPIILTAGQVNLPPVIACRRSRLASRRGTLG